MMLLITVAAAQATYLTDPDCGALVDTGTPVLASNRDCACLSPEDCGTTKLDANNTSYCVVSDGACVLRPRGSRECASFIGPGTVPSGLMWGRDRVQVQHEHECIRYGCILANNACEPARACSVTTACSETPGCVDVVGVCIEDELPCSAFATRDTCPTYGCAWTTSCVASHARGRIAADPSSVWSTVLVGVLCAWLLGLLGQTLRELWSSKATMGPFEALM